MEFLNNDIKFSKIRRKSKIKYNFLFKNSKDAPSFLSTKHFYKRRNTQAINLSNQNINPDDKAKTKLFLPKKYRQKHKSLSLLDDQKLISNSNPLGIIDTDNENKTYKQLSPLTLFEKIKIKAILNSFEKNKLTTHSLYNLEKKYPLNSITENNYLFFFRDYKERKRQSIKQLISTGKAKMSKSSLISLNMMKKFNNRTKKILEADKTEGTKFSSNINEFRKQIINSYKDSVVLRDLNKRKINYYNAMKLLETNNEKRIQKAFELEKEFYKNKNSDTLYMFNSNIIPEEIEPKKRKSKKTPTTIVKKLDEKIAYLSPNVNAKKTKNYNNLTISKSKGIHHNTINSNTIKWINMNNINNYFNKTETNNNSNILKEKASKSLENSNKKKLSKASDNSLLNENRSNNNTFNNKYLNYIYNTNNNTNANIKSKNNSIKNIDKSEREFLNSKEEYKKYIKNCMKQRSKQFADSFASINSYFEYQPLIDMNSDMPHLNINSTNLKRVIKVNNIRKNLYILDDDDLLVQNVKKLKDEVRDAEMKFYTVDGSKKKYNLSFLKFDVKRQTIAKLNHMKNPHFGVPC